ncbi:nuclear envelope integral membrane protein 1-like isoform X1 [Dendronephthya gigantea]|uniref:nuclear envelope integral membrane protein 1-like isoform X1 n=1 Tax=Dendronephthya gigantea TaxID=151771 RepID=UPI00106D3CE0|nr:nuclear envelope integral membrane protein 1-like isoform X1 [Dendronephthya gigantea]
MILIVIFFLLSIPKLPVALSSAGELCSSKFLDNTTRQHLKKPVGLNIFFFSHPWESFQFNSSSKPLCINGHKHNSIWAIWADVEIDIQTEPEDSVNVVSGKSCKEVREKFVSRANTWFPMNWPSFGKTGGSVVLSVPPYGRNCYAISTEGYWEAKVTSHKIRIQYPVALIFGIILFHKADLVARSVLFYYTAGVSMGMIMAVFLLLFVISKFMPQRGIGYVFMFCGSSIVLYFFRFVTELIISGKFADMKIFYAYFISAALVSFLYCYYRGPIESARGLDIMKWSLQSVALFIVYYSIRCEEISLTFVLILITTRWISFLGARHYVLTRGWVPYRLQAYFRRPRLITMEEYEKEGIEETAIALKALREYCESPECNTWKTVSRLKNPKRFASFMYDGDDVTPEERQEYDELSFDGYAPFLTSDEDSVDELTLLEQMYPVDGEICKQ